MICLNCGKHVDDDARVCPFCGNPIESSEGQDEADPMPINLPPRERDDNGFERVRPIEPEESAESAPAPARGGKSIFTPGFFFALLSLILGVLCLTTIFSLRGAVKELAAAQTQSFDTVRTSIDDANKRLDQLDATLAKVQSEAYEQVASKSIEITKNLTPLTKPVAEGTNNQMFIVKAKGNLNVDTSFDWQRYNKDTGNWVSVVFTGDATTNEQYGLRLENQRDAATNEFTTILWAQFITPDAAGTYRCVIKDLTGITKTSDEGIVEIGPKAES